MDMQMDDGTGIEEISTEKSEIESTNASGSSVVGDINHKIASTNLTEPTIEDTEDFRRRYTCYYCGFSVEKFKYIKSHIRRFHVVDSDSTEGCQSQGHKTTEENGNLPEDGSFMDTTPTCLDGTETVKEEITSSSPGFPPPPPLPPSQSKPFNMDLCPYCDFSDKNEKKLRHHILSKHSKELDKIIVYACEEDRPRKEHKSKDTRVYHERPISIFKKSGKPQGHIAQLQNSICLVGDQGSYKPQTSDKNQNNILPFTQTLITGDDSFSHSENESVSSRDGGDFKCPNCDYQTAVSWEYILHTMQSHPSAEHQINNYGLVNGNYNELDENTLGVAQERLFSCVHCSYTTPRMQLLNRHLLSKHSDSRPHKCEHCDYATKRLEHLNRHIISKHSGQKPYKCEYCDYRAARDDHLRNHVLSKHSEEALLRCTNCNYSAVSLEQLNSHMAVKHSDIKTNYTCQLCTYSTMKEEYLTRHMVARHSNMSLCKCDQCEYTTSNPEELNNHMLTHTMQLPHQCKFCEFGFSNLDDLNAHLISKHKSGRPHVCPECDYRATRLGHLTRHIQTRHTGVKPFACSECSYRAGRVEHLQRHMYNRHSNFKPFACQHCDYTTFRDDLLNNHYLTKHMEQGYLTSQFCDIAIKLEEENEMTEELPQEQGS